MASLLSSLLSKYDGLTAANFPGASRPPAFEDPVPDTHAGVTLYVPYVTIAVEQVGSDLAFEFAGVYTFRVTVQAFAYDQGDSDTTIEAVRYDGGTAAQAQGFDLGALPALTDGRLMALAPAGSPQPGFVGYGKDGLRVHSTVMTYTATVQK